jgi:hypothetical protein
MGVLERQVADELGQDAYPRRRVGRPVGPEGALRRKICHLKEVGSLVSDAGQRLAGEAGSLSCAIKRRNGGD